jgi:murein DD-endopeptidase MepM/ murein hydrolase activator NlpD
VAILKTITVVGLGLGVLAGLSCERGPAPTPPAPVRADRYLAPEIETTTGRVPRNATISSLLGALGVRADLVPAIVSLTRTVFNPRGLKTDHEYVLERTFDGLVRRFEYEIDEDRFLRILGPSNRQPEELTVEVVPYLKERTPVAVRGEITKESPSLFEAMDVAGEGADLSLELAGVFEGEIDFNSDLQVGDRFAVAFERVSREGRPPYSGDVLAAEFSNEGRVLKAVRFTVPGGKPAHYDLQGRSLRRFFLKSPLKFGGPISSNFSKARMHPVLRIVRPHLGIDYRAAAGSPVVAVANGVVLSAGWNGDAGRMVHLRHASGYETFYMHLSSIAVRAGQRVGQGDLVGKVGTSGLSTGPHLDYRVKRNGGYITPLQLHKTLPPGEPIPAAHLAAFAEERDRLLKLLAPSGPNLDSPPKVR